MSYFNLIGDPWIRVLDKTCAQREISLLDALLGASEYKDLCGELPVQDIAVLRLLLAVLQTVFYRVDECGKPDPLREHGGVDHAKERWETLWNMGRFPEKPIREYLERWRERFYLFDETHPFYQVPEAKIGTEYTAAKLNGELSESSNKARLFPLTAGQEKQKLTCAEAARWLLFVSGSDDTSAKPKNKNLPSPGVGWLGKLGLIYAAGDNLFETLMLNFVLFDSNGELWGEPRPVWERDVARKSERTAIAPPDNQAELLTLQSRRLLLRRENETVTGYCLLGGDFFESTDVLEEQMTVWKKIPGKGGKAPEYHPKRHDPARQLWRDFGAVFALETEKRRPGIVNWYNTLAEMKDWTSSGLANFRIAAVGYGDKDFFVNDAFSDSISFQAALVSELGQAWQERIVEEIDRCEKTANEIAMLAERLFLAGGGSDNSKTKSIIKARKERARTEYYTLIDQPFRRWLRSIDPATEREAAKNKQAQWQETAKKTATCLGKEMVDGSGEKAFVGRTVKETKDKNKQGGEWHYSACEAYNAFVIRVNKVYKR